MSILVRRTVVGLLATVGFLSLVACTSAVPADNSTVRSTSGVSQASTRVDVGSDGLTAEQRNVRDRLQEDNKPGAIKHLYVISPYSGQVLLYSTVRGKVTSSGKRLAPRTVAAADGAEVSGEFGGIPVSINSHTRRTTEVLEDDGTYGSSVEYIYWWDVQGRYHQHFFTGGQILHVSSEPIPVKSVVLNLEISNGSGQP